MGVAAAHPHLILVRPESDAGRMAINKQRIDSLMPFFGIRLSDQNIRRCRICAGNPVFHPIYQVMIAFVDGGGTLGSGIRSGFRLRKEKRADFFTTGKWFQPFFLLFLRTVRFNAIANQ